MAGAVLGVAGRLQVLAATCAGAPSELGGAFWPARRVSLPACSQAGFAAFGMSGCLARPARRLKRPPPPPSLPCSLAPSNHPQATACPSRCWATACPSLCKTKWCRWAATWPHVPPTHPIQPRCACCAVPCCAVPCCAVLHRAVLCCAVLCWPAGHSGRPCFPGSCCCLPRARCAPPCWHPATPNHAKVVFLLLSFSAPPTPTPSGLRGHPPLRAV